MEKELDRLYAAPLDEFVAERDALAKRLRSDGDREAADRVKALRKPSAAVWAVNQLARRQQKDYRALLEAGDRLREAQEQVLGGESPDTLQEAASAERKLVERMSEKGRAVLEVAGHSPTEATVRRLGATLHAAATRPDLREAAENGRLEHEEETSGFGFDLLSGVPAAPKRQQGEDKRARERKEAASERLKAARDELADARDEAKEAAVEVKRLTRELARASTEEDRRAKEVERRERAVEEARAKLDELG